MMISASGEEFVPFSATRGGRVAKSVKIWAFAGCYRYGLAQSSRWKVSSFSSFPLSWWDEQLMALSSR
jgi:hypothetical protein